MPKNRRAAHGRVKRLRIRTKLAHLDLRYLPADYLLLCAAAREEGQLSVAAWAKSKLSPFLLDQRKRSVRNTPA